MLDLFSKHSRFIVILSGVCFLLSSIVYWSIFIRHREDVHGLHGIYYANTAWQGEPWKGNLIESEISSKAEIFRQAEQQLNNQFSVEWKGYIQIPTTDDYTFTTNSDDGSWIFIDDKLVVDNGGAHGLQEVQGTIYLTKGLHKIRIRYFQIGGYARLNIFWVKGADPKAPLTSDVLFPPNTHLARAWYPVVRQGLLLLMIFLGGLEVAFLIFLKPSAKNSSGKIFQIRSKGALLSIFILAVILRSLVPLYLIRNNVDDPFRYMLSSKSVQRWYLSNLIVRRFQARFRLGRSSMRSLRNEGIPEAIVSDLKALKNRGFNTKDDFLDAVEKQIGKEQGVRYQEQILKHAEVHIPTTGRYHVKHALLTAGFIFLTRSTDNSTTSSVARVQIVQGVIDSIGCLVIWGILGIYFSRRIQLLGALLYAVWPPSIFFSYHILAEAYIPVLVLALAYTGILSIQRQKWYFYALAGSFCALILFFRLDNALIVPAYIAYIFLMYRQKLRRAIEKGGLVIIFFILFSWGFNIITSYAVGSKVSTQHTSLLGITFYNGLGEYPGTFKGLRFFNDTVSEEYGRKKADQYLQENDAIFKLMYSRYDRDPILLAFIREVIIAKPILYADSFIRRFLAYIPALPYNACIAYFYASPKNYYQTMIGYRYSQIYQGIKYVDYFLFFLFVVGVWYCRHNKAMLSVLGIYLGVLIGHVLIACGEVYFSRDLEYAYVQPKYLLGMVSIWPIFITLGLRALWQRMKKG